MEQSNIQPVECLN